MTKTSYVLGLDVGQAADPTALVLLEQDQQQHPTYSIRALHRLPLGTPYTALPQAINKRLSQPPLAGHTRLAIDATGVGRPVIDLFKHQLADVPLYAITITGGTTVTGSGTQPHVPKRDLITTTSVILEQHRLRIPASLPDTQALLDELLAFRRTRSETGHDSYVAPPGSHDDLVLALSLAVWLAEHKRVRYSEATISVPTGRLPTVEEMIRERLRRHNNPYY